MFSVLFKRKIGRKNLLYNSRSGGNAQGGGDVPHICKTKKTFWFWELFFFQILMVMPPAWGTPCYEAATTRPRRDDEEKTWTRYAFCLLPMFLCKYLHFQNCHKNVLFKNHLFTMNVFSVSSMHWGSTAQKNAAAKRKRDQIDAKGPNKRVRQCFLWVFL